MVLASDMVSVLGVEPSYRGMWSMTWEVIVGFLRHSGDPVDAIRIWVTGQR